MSLASNRHRNHRFTAACLLQIRTWPIIAPFVIGLRHWLSRCLLRALADYTCYDHLSARMSFLGRSNPTYSTDPVLSYTRSSSKDTKNSIQTTYNSLDLSFRETSTLYNPLLSRCGSATETDFPPTSTTSEDEPGSEPLEDQPSYAGARTDAADATALASIEVKQHHDRRHNGAFLEAGDMSYVRVHLGYTVPPEVQEYRSTDAASFHDRQTHG